MSRALCFIPARGGSKRIPRKNVRPLAGKPLLAYTVEAAQASGAFAEIVVSSDDAEVLALAERLGVRGDERPAELGGDRVRFVEVLEELLLRTGAAERFDNIAALLPTCPFRSPADVLGAAELLARTPDASVVSVCEYDFPPEFACDLTCDQTLLLRHPEVYQRSTQSQSVGKACHPNGAIYMSAVRRFLEHRSFFTPPVLGYQMPPERSFDLDHPHQWETAEAVILARSRN